MIKNWIAKKLFKKEFEKLINEISAKEKKIKNLTKHINHLTMKGPLL